MERLSVFVLGATGYIGGSVLVGLLQHQPSFSYSALVRDPKKAGAVAALGVTVVEGSNEEVEMIEAICSQVDCVVNCANADDVGLTTAILKGLFNRAKTNAGGRKPILLHTSGTGVVTDKPEGKFHTGYSEKIYDNPITLKDNVPADIEGIDAKQPHRNVDLQIFAANESGNIDAFIVAPSTIYGKGIGPGNQLSQQVNGMVRTGVKHEEVLYVGDGTNVWNNVHVEDLINLYNLVFDLALSGEDENTSYGRFYWGSAGEHVWGEVAKSLAKNMHAKGFTKTDTPKSVSIGDAPELRSTATNSRTVANRGFALGWTPSRPKLFEILDDEVQWTVKEE